MQTQRAEGASPPAQLEAQTKCTNSPKATHSVLFDTLDREGRGEEEEGGGKGASNISYKLQALKALRLCKTQAHFRLKFIYKISKIETRTQKRERKKN